MASLSDIFKTNQRTYGSLTPSGKNYASLSPMPITTRTLTLPNSTDTYPSPVIAQAPTQIIKPIVPASSIFPTTAPSAPIVSNPQSAPSSVPQIPAEWLKPGGGLYTAQEVVANMEANKLKSQVPAGGAVPQYAGDALANPNQTIEEMNRSAYGLNNARNDIATGTTDPYKAASQSGIAYSPSELIAIEKAYAGIYDPALSDVFTKIKEKQDVDKAALDQKNEMAKLAQQQKYALELKRTPTYAESVAPSMGSTSVYTPGANPAVDAWAERINNGTAKISEIPSTDKGMRNAVTVALQSMGNTPTGKPTTTELGLQALSAANNLLTMFDEGRGTSMVGKSRLFGGGFATPGSDSADFEVLFNNLTADRSLEGAKFLKGQGQVSDAERQLLKDAMNTISLSQSEPEFRKKLVTIINKLTTGSAEGTTILRSPDGTQEVNISDLTPAELKEAKDAGWQ